MTGKSIVLFPPALLFGVLLLGCGSPPPLVLDEVKFESLLGTDSAEAQMVRLGAERPQILLRAYPFEGGLLTSDSLELGGDWQLQFTPLFSEQAPEDCRVETSLVSEGREEVIDAGDPRKPKAKRPAEDSDWKKIFENRVSLDLSAYRGRRVRFKWILRREGSGLCPGVKAALGNVKLRSKSPGSPPRPSILFICSDAHRYDQSAGTRGGTLMPRLKALQDQAVVYRHAYSPGSWTLPSIVSTFTGLFPRLHRTGQRIQSVPAEDVQARSLPPGQFLLQWKNNNFVLTAYPRRLTTLTERLQREGYVTTMVLSNPIYVLSGLHEDGQDIVVDTGLVPATEVNEAAFQVLENVQRGEPLFLLVHYMDVHEHGSWYLSKRYPGQRQELSRGELVACYEEAARDVDRAVGALLDRWGEKVGVQESLVVFYSDHGEHLLDPGRPVIGHGQSMDEVLLRIPLIVKYPASSGVAPGEVDEPVSLVDLPATVLDLLGVEVEPAPYAGVSLRDAGKARSQRPLFADYQLYDDELSSIRQGPWKMVINLTRGGQALIDTGLPAGDSGEKSQEVQQLSRQAQLEKAFEAYTGFSDRVTEGLRSDREIDQEQALEDLRALGYVE